MRLKTIIFGLWLAINIFAEDMTDTAKFFSDVNKWLPNKTFGFESNPLRWIAYFPRYGFSGTFSIYIGKLNAEIAVPFFYMKPHPHFPDGRFVDLSFRKYLFKNGPGYYANFFIRYVNLEGYLGRDSLILAVTDTTVWSTQNKIGICIGVGWRGMHKYLTINISANIGVFLNRKNDIFIYTKPLFNNDERVILDVEFVKIGFAI